MFDHITPLVITYNEAPNIARTLNKLSWARRIVVIDSGSTDATLDLLRGYPQVLVIHHPFSDFATQCNFGLTQIDTPWVLSLDADYELSNGLVDEIGALTDNDSVSGYRVPFVYRIYGRSLRGTLYPPRVVLYRAGMARYVNEGHGHRVIIEGEVRALRHAIYHDDRKPLARWFASQQRYAAEEADYLFAKAPHELRRTDRLRRMAWPAPLGVLFYTLFAKGCILDGWAGWFYALQRLVAEVLIALAVLDRRLRGADDEPPGGASGR
jgi:glycosyltransferase involved in cell wall biosynthesis